MISHGKLLYQVKIEFHKQPGLIAVTIVVSLNPHLAFSFCHFHQHIAAGSCCISCIKYANLKNTSNTIFLLKGSESIFKVQTPPVHLLPSKPACPPLLKWPPANILFKTMDLIDSPSQQIQQFPLYTWQ